VTPEWILASDIDNTLTGDEKAVIELRDKINALRNKGSLFLILTTGRRLEQVISGIENEHLPEADAVISQVGTEIYMPPFKEGAPPLRDWEIKLKNEFSRQTAESFVEGIEGVEIQPEMYNTPLKASFYMDNVKNAEEAVDTIKKRASKLPGYQVVWSSGRDLDIIPASAGKGKAISFLVQDLGFTPHGVIPAGDSGNDRAMFEEFRKGIVVANAKPELKAIKTEPMGEKIFFATKNYAAGVMEGLKHYEIL